MERETKTIQTPVGKSLVLKSFITAREEKKIKSVFSKNIEVDLNAENAVSKVPAALLVEFSEEVINSVAVSYDGVTEGILEKVLDLPLNEFNFIQEECMKVYNGNLNPEK